MRALLPAAARQPAACAGRGVCGLSRASTQPRAARSAPQTCQSSYSRQFTAARAARRLLASSPQLPLPFRARRPARGSVLRPQAGLWSLPADLYGSLQTGFGITFLLGLGFSALPILTGESLERNEKRFLTPSDDDSAENVRWSVMSVLSVLPFVNPLAWVFAALDDDDSSTLYYSLAFIYSLPYIANGFEVDGFAIVSVLACILHVQVERLAQTEPVEVELPSVLRRLLAGIPLAIRSLGRYSARLGGEVSERSRSAEHARKRRPDRKYLEERSREARAELEEFDRRRRERAQDWVERPRKQPLSPPPAHRRELPKRQEQQERQKESER